MRALVYHGVDDIRLEERAVPQPGVGEVRVRVEVCGVCGSDAAELDHGPVLTRPPVTLGHEFVGLVDAVGPGVDDLQIGARVVCGAGISCGSCRPCRTGRTNMCDDYRTAGLTDDGGLAGYVVVPRTTLHDVSGSTLSPDTLALTQPMAIAVHAARRGGVGSHALVALVGAGGIGAFLTIVASRWAGRVVVFDINDERLALARRLGADDCCNPTHVDPVAFAAERELRFDIVFEVSGTVAGLRTALALLPRGGTLVPVGIQHGDVDVPVGRWTVQEITVVGTNAHVFSTDVPAAVGILETVTVADELAPEVIPLPDAVAEGLEPLRRGQASRIKTLVDPWAEFARPAVHHE